ncbi:unnamed protein product [Plutella xylostella]|uniref:(diamondback moth) hypothetical protein n=1 Tax=Plutella xylostella TaxID=51655 RepID=A0A8S4DHT4_PLUXY|nr:unnamed protein product [Plutella xylostella]
MRRYGYEICPAPNMEYGGGGPVAASANGRSLIYEPGAAPPPVITGYLVRARAAPPPASRSVALQMASRAVACRPPRVSRVLCDRAMRR